jgi:hypothetical protein
VLSSWIFGKEKLRINASYLVTVTNRPSIRVAVPRIVRCISYIHADPKGQRRVAKGLEICIAKYFYSITRTGICKNPLHDHYHHYPLLSSIILYYLPLKLLSLLRNRKTSTISVHNHDALTCSSGKVRVVCQVHRGVHERASNRRSVIRSTPLFHAVLREVGSGTRKFRALHRMGAVR